LPSNARQREQEQVRQEPAGDQDLKHLASDCSRAASNVTACAAWPTRCSKSSRNDKKSRYFAYM
jgi:hypothetical protein